MVTLCFWEQEISSWVKEIFLETEFIRLTIHSKNRFPELFKKIQDFNL